jgi:hypothetical protein
MYKIQTYRYAILPDFPPLAFFLVGNTLVVVEVVVVVDVVVVGEIALACRDM